MLTDTEINIDSAIAEHEKVGKALRMLKKAIEQRELSQKLSTEFPLLHDMNSHWKRRTFVYGEIIKRLKNYIMNNLMEISV
jgi:hypothetical protein